MAETVDVYPYEKLRELNIHGYITRKPS